ncbi:hypothetical protein [Sulfurimonas sp.]|uniref:hypothetical protein n=1 Tax=Sulfurimonas sp. TaxID=2022749 RepID=UPI002630FF4A|nr:hypothetical protein [Sulfurimonas sp.]MDD3855278.1 hypothetical protein [Sulfurimonas sp.]
MKHIYNNDKLEIQKLEHSNKMIKIGSIIFTLISAVIMAMMFLKIVEEREANGKKEKITNEIKNQNVNLQREIIEHQNQIAYLNRRIEILLTEQRRAYQQQQEIEQRQVRRYEPTPQPRQEEVKPNTTFSPQVPSISNIKPIQQNYNQNIPRYTPPKPMKMYPRYSVAKLVSDSKIEVMSDNRLKSNMPIYGRYIDRPVVALECGKNERVYKIVNECTATVFPLEKIYFKESNKKSIQNNDRNTHMVECMYNYENGIMHDCNVKLIGVR